MLQKHAEPSGFGEEENASEVALYLPIEAPQGSGAAEGGGNSSDSAVVAISSIRQQDRPPPSRTRISGRRRKRATVPGGGPGNNGGSLGGGKGKGRNRRSPTPRTVPVAFDGIRFQNVSDESSHALKVSFNNPGDRVSGSRLVTVMEDGNEREIKIIKAIDNDGRELEIDRKTGAIKSIESESERITVEMQVLEPVANKTFLLREIDLEK